jgi:hypothetical protein
VYDVTDPRTALASVPRPAAGPTVPSYPADYVTFPDVPPDRDEHGSRHWYARGQNFVVAYSECAEPATLRRTAQPDEWMLLLPGRGTTATITAGGQLATVTGYSLAVVPAGDSKIEISGGGTVVRIFSRNAADLCARAVNAGSYTRDHANVAPLTPWPAPPDGARIRIYSLDVPPKEGRFGRIWRCSTLMVNVLDPLEGPRDESKLSPHSHDDFEQGSLALEGEYVHHIRWPWTADRRAWRPDDHQCCGSPSLAIIPPPAIHTSQATGAGINQLVDIFSPPRRDFSAQPGWVLNASEYPAPEVS